MWKNDNWSRSWISDQTKTENEILFSRKIVKVKILQIACQKVLKQYCHKSVLRIKQKLKKMDLTGTSCVIIEIVDQSFIFSERFNWKGKAST